MKTEFVLELMDKSAKPVVQLYHMRMLIDTGADVPVCYLPEENLVKQFRARKVAENIPIGTFANEVIGNVYKLEEFRMGQLVFPELTVFHPRLDGLKKTPEYLMILSASMLYDLIYEIDMKHKQLIIKVPDDEDLVRHVIVFDTQKRKFILANG